MLVAAVAAGPRAVAAPAEQPSSGELAAQALFDEGRKLMDAGDFVAACPKLAESQRLDPGGGTLLNLAVCHEGEGKLATAWLEFKSALAQAQRDGRKDRQRLAEERLAALEPRIAHVTVRVAAAADVPGLAISLDGVSLGRSSRNVALPLDPGQHVVEATAPGFAAWRRTITVSGDGANETAEIDRLERTAPAAQPAPATAPVVTGAARPAGSAPNAVAASVEADPSVQVGAGYVVGATGLASLAAGFVLGGVAMSKGSASDELCAETVCPNSDDGAEAVALNDQAHTFATLANVFVGVGAGLTAVGLIVLLAAPGEPSEPAIAARLAPWASPTGGGVSAHLSF